MNWRSIHKSFFLSWVLTHHPLLAQILVPPPKTKPQRECVLVDSFRHSITRNGRPANFPVRDTPPRALAGHQLALAHLNTANGRVIPQVAELTDCNIYFSAARYYDTEGSKGVGVDQVLEAIENRTDLCAFTGAFSSSVSVASALVTSLKGYAQFSAFSQTNQLEDTANYPLFGRTVPSNDQFAGPLLEFLTEVLRVTHLTVVYSAQSETHTTFLGGFRDFLIHYPDLVVETIGFDENANVEAVVRAIQQTGHRYFLGMVRFEQFEALLQEVDRQGLLGADYQWIVASTSLSTMHSRDLPKDSVLGQAGDGIMSFTIRSTIPGVGRYDAFAQAFAELNNAEDKTYLTSLLPQHENAPDYNPSFRNQTFSVGAGTGARVYDLVIALGLAACSVNGTLNSASLFDAWKKVSFEGATGTVQFDDTTGSRRPETALYSIANLVRSDTNGTHLKLSVEWPYIYNGGWEREKDLVYSTGKTTAPAILPPIKVDYNYIDWGWRSGGWVLAFISILASFGAAGFTWWNRGTYVVRASQPSFLLMICFGVLLMASAIFPLSIDDEVASADVVTITCNMGLPLFYIGWCVSFAALFSKTRRVNLVFQQPRFQRVTVKAKDVVPPMLALLSINLLILGLWIGLDPFHWVRETRAVDDFDRPKVSRGECRCDQRWAFEAPLLMVNAGVMLMAVQQLYVARKISTDFAETDWMARALHSILIVSFVGIPVVVIAQDDSTAYFFVRSAIIFIICMSLIGFIFVPKILYKTQQKEDTGIEGSSRIASPSSHRFLKPSNSFSFNESNNQVGVRVLEHPGRLGILEDELERQAKEIEELKRKLVTTRIDEESDLQSN